MSVYLPVLGESDNVAVTATGTATATGTVAAADTDVDVEDGGDEEEVVAAAATVAAATTEDTDESTFSLSFSTDSIIKYRNKQKVKKHTPHTHTS